MIIAVSQASFRPPRRRAANQIATIAPSMKTPDMERTATLLVPNAAVQKWSST